MRSASFVASALESARFMAGFYRLGVVPDCLSLFLLPRLIGLAYAFQVVASIGAAAHDVLMDAVVTEEGFTRCTTG